ACPSRSRSSRRSSRSTRGRRQHRTGSTSTRPSSCRPPFSASMSSGGKPPSFSNLSYHGQVAEDILRLPLQYLKGVGPRKAADLKKAGLLTVEDLLFRFPLRYEDRSRLQPIIAIKPGQ